MGELQARGIIFNIMKYSVHDGPGIRTTVFLKGCPLTCWWCHNPESQERTPELMVWDSKCIGCGECRQACKLDAVSDVTRCTVCGKCVDRCHSCAREMVGRQVTGAELLREIEKDVIFYDESGGGVTFSGGEPLMQPEFLTIMLASCQRKGIHTAVDTTGFASTDTLLAISRLTDLFLYDLKLMDDALHRQYTGVSNRLILKNLQELSLNHNNIRIRFPLIPDVNDDVCNVEKLGEFVASLRGVSQVHVIPYQPMGVCKYDRLRKDYRLQAVTAPDQEKIEAVANKLKQYGLTVKIGG